MLWVVAILVLCQPFQGWSQYPLEGYHRVDPATLTADTTNPLDFHLSLSTGVITSNYAGSRSYISAAPRLSYQLNDEWKLKAGFAMTTDMSYLTIQPPVRSLAPVRQGTTVGAGWVGAEYQPNDRLRIAGSVFYVGGQWQPMFGPMSQQGAMPVGAYGANATIQYRTGNNSWIELNVGIVRDEAGTLGPLLWDQWYGGRGSFYGLQHYGLLAEPCGYGWGAW